jgi:hypothetical protein
VVKLFCSLVLDTKMPGRENLDKAVLKFFIEGRNFNRLKLNTPENVNGTMKNFLFFVQTSESDRHIKIVISSTPNFRI